MEQKNNIEKRMAEREHAFLVLFSHSFNQEIEDILAALQDGAADYTLDEYGTALVNFYLNNAEAIDSTIQDNLKDWRLERLSKVNLAVLRLATAEMLYGESGMDSVVINEAVELSKKYGDDDDYRFVNGVLGSVSRSQNDAPQDSETP